jgi:hypothetical protein
VNNQQDVWGIIQEFAFDNDISNDVSMGWERRATVSLSNGCMSKRSIKGVWRIFNPAFLIGSTSNGESCLYVPHRQAIQKRR